MIELQIKMKRTSELEDYEMKSLIALKQKHWGYTDEEQRNWFDENIMDDDYHLLVFFEGILLAYLNAVNVDVTVNHASHKMMGIGNVCIDKEVVRKGVGSILMACINAYIKQSDFSAILLCKEELIGFYEAANWEVVFAENISIKEQPYNYFVMSYGPLKTCLPEEIKELKFSRSF